MESRSLVCAPRSVADVRLATGRSSSPSATRGRRSLHPGSARHPSIVRDSRIEPSRALEVGGSTGPGSLLRMPELEGCDRFCLNLREKRSDQHITAVRGNANHMSMFDDGMFDLVLCNATLEHDKFFWLSLAEMKRVLAPGRPTRDRRPGYVRDRSGSTASRSGTLRVHYKFDFYRFSDQAVREVFFELHGRRASHYGSPVAADCGSREESEPWPPGPADASVPRLTRVRKLVRRAPVAPAAALVSCTSSVGRAAERRPSDEPHWTRVATALQ